MLLKSQDNKYCLLLLKNNITKLLPSPLKFLKGIQNAMWSMYVYHCFWFAPNIFITLNNAMALPLS